MRNRRLPLDDLEKKAKVVMRHALTGYNIPEEMRNHLDVAKGYDGDVALFILYIPGEPREEGRVIAKLELDSKTAEVRQVSVYLGEDPSGVRIKDLDDRERDPFERV